MEILQALVLGIPLYHAFATILYLLPVQVLREEKFTVTEKL